MKPDNPGWVVASFIPTDCPGCGAKDLYWGNTEIDVGPTGPVALQMATCGGCGWEAQFTFGLLGYNLHDAGSAENL